MSQKTLTVAFDAIARTIADADKAFPLMTSTQKSTFAEWICKLTMIVCSMHARIACGVATNDDIQQFAEFIYSARGSSTLLPSWTIAKCRSTVGLVGALAPSLDAKQTVLWTLLLKAAGLKA